MSISALSAWALPFGQVDASYTGALNRDDFCYFFRGNQYVRYSWSADHPDGSAKAPSPASRINVTRHFLERTELNRVSSLIHEAMHVNDPLSGSATTHISEWYVTAPMAATLGLVFMPATFATRYDLMTTTDALHNPSAYATFARHVSFGVDTREVP